MQRRASDSSGDGIARDSRRSRAVSLSGIALLLAALFPDVPSMWATAADGPNSTLPDAPQPQNSAPAAKPEADPCQVKYAGAAMGSRAAEAAAAAAGFPAPAAGSHSRDTDEVPCLSSAAFVKNLPIIKKLPIVNWYARFLDGPQVKPMTPSEKAWLAVRNVGDPFNSITILASSAIAVGSNSHSAYGPGMTGFGRYVGVSYTQDITGEFFGTFLIPSIVHQDPHYHRVPTASMKRRIAHAFYQVVWTQGDNGRGMVNYADLVGFAIDDEIGNLYVPGRKTDLPSSASRYGTAMATAPIDNFVSEFLPDVARHIHVQIVVIQRIINQVANKDAAGTP